MGSLTPWNKIFDSNPVLWKLHNIELGGVKASSTSFRKLWCQTAEEWGNPVYIQSVRKKVPLRELSLNLASQSGSV